MTRLYPRTEKGVNHVRVRGLIHDVSSTKLTWKKLQRIQESDKCGKDNEIFGSTFKCRKLLAKYLYTCHMKGGTCLAYTADSSRTHFAQPKYGIECLHLCILQSWFLFLPLAPAVLHRTRSMMKHVATLLLSISLREQQDSLRGYCRHPNHHLLSCSKIELHHPFWGSR